MKRFRFPLQPVAVLRAHREMRAREAFAAALQAYVQTEEILHATRRRVAQFEAALSAGRRETFSPAREAESLAAYQQERTTETAAEQAMNTARTALQQRRNDYLEAHRRVEVVKRLEQKARIAHRLAGNREEQAEFDDLAGRRFRSRRNSVST